MKIGRNDPCPCGRGRKYKNCCLEGQGPGLPPEDPAGVFAEIRHALQGRQFSSFEEVQAFTERFMRQRNQAPIADFHGLSPDQMHRILHFPFDSPNLVTYATVVAGEPRAPILALFHLLAEAIGEQGLKATATGNLPRNVCREAASAYWGEEAIRVNGRFAHISKEEDSSPPHVTRLVAGLAGVVRKFRGRFILGRECRRSLTDHGLGGIYPRLVLSYVRDFNWGYRDGFTDLGLIQRSFLFTLYLLDLHGGEWLPEVYYEHAFLRAFPMVFIFLQPNSYTIPEKTVRKCYT